MLFIELFGLGSLTEAVRMYGIQCPDPADIKTTGEDLSKMCNIQQIHKMLEWFGVAVLHTANPCTAFACPQRMNQAKWPAGKFGAMQAPYIAMLEKLLPLYVTPCRGQNGIPGFMVMEGPGKGLMWKIHVIQKLIALCGLKMVIVNRCPWDLQSLKPTMLLTNLPKWTWVHMQLPCVCPPGYHIPLSGADKNGVANTKHAEIYGPRFANGLALMHANGCAIVQRARLAYAAGKPIPDMNVPIRNVARYLRQFNGMFAPVLPPRPPVNTACDVKAGSSHLAAKPKMDAHHQATLATHMRNHGCKLLTTSPGVEETNPVPRPPIPASACGMEAGPSHLANEPNMAEAFG